MTMYSENNKGDPYYHSRLKWNGGWSVLIGGLLGAFVAWWFAVAVAVGMMVMSLVDIFIIAKREAKRDESK